MKIFNKKFICMDFNFEGYILQDDLCSVVEVVIVFGQLLLLIGELGIGKILLVFKIVYELNKVFDSIFCFKLLVFNIKMIFIVCDLFYIYDVVFYF